MNQKCVPQEPLVFEYLTLRKAVGIIGLALPFVLALGKIFSGYPGIEPSISHYYYTDVRNFFVGSLCAIGIFLMSTRGYDRKDHIAGILASVFALGVAFFPTSFDHRTLIGSFHLAFAALLFLTLAYFCLKLFVKTSGNPTRQKLKRNAVYRASGYAILVSILLIVVAAVPQIDALIKQLKPRFWLESIAIIAFGVAWLTKGEAILKDEETQDRTLQVTGVAAR